MTSDEEIIKLAYAMAVGPHRFTDLFLALSERVNEKIEESPADMHLNEAAIKPAFAPLETHFENALSLMVAQGRRQNTAQSSVKIIESDSRPSALLTPQGRVHYANVAAQEILGLKAGMALQTEQFEFGHFKDLTTNLAGIERFEANKIISMIGMIAPHSDETIKIALTRVSGIQGEIFGHISAVNISWLPHIADRFEDLFNLTPVEMEITQAIVMGTPLSVLAKKRKRALGTVRQQCKKLLAKLDLRSQTELACLYSGFSKFNLDRAENLGEIIPEDRIDIEQHILIRDRKRILDYEIVGPASGKPVLFFPALLGGTVVPPNLRQALNVHKIKLIMVWRPGMSKSGVDGAADFDAFKRYADDVAALLDVLKIKECGVIGHVTSAMFAYAVGHYLPDRISKIVTVNGILPTIRGPHLALLDRGERLRMIFARHTPKIGRMVIHSMLAKVDAGFDEEFLDVFLNNETDRVTTRDNFIRISFRQAFTQTTLQGYECYVNEVGMAALDWEPLLQNLKCSVTALAGQHNPIYTPEVLTTYFEGKAGFDVLAVPNTAHLLFYQNPEPVLEAVA